MDPKNISAYCKEKNYNDSKVLAHSALYANCPEQPWEEEKTDPASSAASSAAKSIKGNNSE